MSVEHDLKGLPLVEAVHGSSYSSRYFDACPENSIQRISQPLSIPVAAIDRPGYKSTTALPDPTNVGNDSHFQNEAKWLHNIALPALWREYGVPSRATSISLLAHSIGSAACIIVAALHAQDSTNDRPAYPLSSFVMTGLGSPGKEI